MGESVGSGEGGGGNGGGTAVSASTSILVGVMGEVLAVSASKSILVGVMERVVSFLGVVVGDWLVGDLSDLVVSSGNEAGGRWAISSKMDLLVVGGYTGMYFLRNFLFLSVCLPDPSILMRYWWNWRTSMTMPVRSHLVG